MNQFKFAVLLVCVLMIMFIGGSAFSVNHLDSPSITKIPGNSISSRASLSYVPGEVMVKFKPGTVIEKLQIIENIAGLSRTLESIGPSHVTKEAQLMKIRDGVSVERSIRRLRLFDEVIYAEPNYVRKIFYEPSDPSFSKQWGLHNTGQIIKGVQGTNDADIDAPEAWNIEKGDSNPVTVAVIDSGIDFSHPDLDSKILGNGYNWAGISQTKYTSEQELGSSGDTDLLAQSIVGTGQNLTSVGVRARKTGNPGGEIRIDVRDSLGGISLASCTIPNWEVSSSFSYFTKPLSSPVMLQSGQSYYIGFSTEYHNPSNYYCLSYNDGSSPSYDTYRDGMMYRRDGATSSWHGYPDKDFFFRTNANSCPQDDNGHGTHVSGILGAEGNDQGIAGVSFGSKTKIMPLKVADSAGNVLTSHISSALYYAADNGADVMNMSLGSNDFSHVEQQAIDYAYKKGVVVLAGVGNDGNSSLIYPAGCQHVIGVGATNNQDGKWHRSNYNSSVDVVAPGKNIYSTTPTYQVAINSKGIAQNYDYMTGTSMACPMTAGLAALILSRHPLYSPLQVEQEIQENADDLGTTGRDDYFGHGRINAYQSLVSTAARPAEVFYFAEGTTRTGFEEWITIQNPNSEDAQVKITYMRGDGSTTEKDYTVKANSRETVGVNSDVGSGDTEAYDVSAKVESTNGVSIVAERPMYFNYQGLANNNWQGGHDVSGIPSPAEVFYFAEGTTRTGFEEWITIQNPNSEDAQVKITYMRGDGSTTEKYYTVKANSRETVGVNSDVGTGDTEAYDVSAKVESTNGVSIVAERPMYFNYQGMGAHNWQGAHDVSGIPSPAEVFYFAEGTTRTGFEEWITIQNPNSEDAQVKITYMRGDSTSTEKTYAVEANSRKTVGVNAYLGTGDSIEYDVSAKVESINGITIVAERPMYFNYQGLAANNWRGGHNVRGIVE